MASAYFEQTFDFSNVDFVSGLTFDINGTEIAMSSTLVSTVSNINWCHLGDWRDCKHQRQ